MKLKAESLEGLITELRSFTSKNRDSITDEDVDLLNECIRHLELSRNNLERGSISLEHISKAVEILVKFFVVAEKVQDFFDQF
jgi:hypothetical protein